MTDHVYKPSRFLRMLPDGTPDPIIFMRPHNSEIIFSWGGGPVADLWIAVCKRTGYIYCVTGSEGETKRTVEEFDGKTIPDEILKALRGLIND